MRSQSFRVTSGSADAVYWASATRLDMPPEWLFLNRLQWGIFAILADLGAGPGIHGLWREVIESKTEIVRLEHVGMKTRDHDDERL